MERHEDEGPPTPSDAASEEASDGDGAEEGLAANEDGTLPVGG